MDCPADNPPPLPPTTYLRSPSNPRLKQVARLRDRRGRGRQGRILIDGWREIAYAARRLPIQELYFPRGQALTTEQLELLGQLAGTGSMLFELDAAAHQKIAFGQRHEAVAVARITDTGLENLALPARPIVAVVEGVEKPGNLGAILRTADALGIDAVIACDPATDLFNPNAIRASMGTVFTLPVAAAARHEVGPWIRERVEQLVVARVDGTCQPWEVDFRRGTALVLGSEAHGVSPIWKQTDMTSVSIPMGGTADSLNVSVAAALLFYEALRQRRHGA